MTIHNKTIGLGTATLFEFKYVPQLGRTTKPGGPEDSRLRTGLAGSGRRGLTTTLVLAAALVGSVAWLGSRSASGLLAAVHADS